MSPNSKFTKRTGEELTFAAYYGQNYDKQIKEHDQPLLVHRHRYLGGHENFAEKKSLSSIIYIW